MFLSVIFLCAGLALILGGASILVDGASAVARRFHIRELVIGLTVVAFGTSAPEFVISFMSSIKGSSSLAIGNVVGSNIFNILVIVGCTALIYPISVEKGTLRREIPFALLSSLVLFFCGSDVLIDGAGENVVSRADGFLLLCFFMIFLAYTFSVARNDGEMLENPEGAAVCPIWKSCVLIVGGLVGLVCGGELFVRGASGVAVGFGVSEAVVGLTVVAAGTSLPELATSVMAALKRNPGIAVGNVVGSCLFNVFFVLGSSAALRPLDSSAISLFDYGVLAGSSALLFLFGWLIGERKITRVEGGALLAVYVCYTVYLVIMAQQC